MINRLDLSQAAPHQRAEFIYAQARADLSSRLWRAALGDADAAPGEQISTGAAPTEGALEALVALIERERSVSAPAPQMIRSPEAPVVERVTEAAPAPTPINTAVGGLGANARYQPSLQSAAQRTGIPAAALAAIVDAEAAKGSDGSWKLYSRNPRSSAAGLGQFLSGTWIGEAERPGTWLNAAARERGWLTERGKIAGSARAELLALRYDAEASINATADYARANLDRLRKAGVSIEGGVEGTARAAYLGHHLGLGDAIRFMKGGLDSSRARLLLNAQVGTAAASRRIASAGDATDAHRSWLLAYVGRTIRPERFEV